VSAQRIRGALVYTAGMSIDADGDPAAYDPGGHGDDALGNAGRPGHWFGVLVDAKGDPVVQGDGDPYPGRYIPTTSLFDRSRKLTDPRAYVDSRVVPYASIPRELLHDSIETGDVGVACYGDKRCAFIVADIGPHGKYGEGSIALARALGINPDPRRGGTSSGVTWVFFPGSARMPKWPRSNDDVARDAMERFVAWAGNPPQLPV